MEMVREQANMERKVGGHCSNIKLKIGILNMTKTHTFTLM